MLQTLDEYLTKDSALPWTILAITSSAILYRYYGPPLRRLPLPPGPEPKLVSGNVHQLPSSDPWKTYKEWSSIYVKHVDSVSDSMRDSVGDSTSSKSHQNRGNSESPLNLRIASGADSQVESCLILAFWILRHGQIQKSRYQGQLQMPPKKRKALQEPETVKKGKRGRKSSKKDDISSESESDASDQKKTRRGGKGSKVKAEKTGPVLSFRVFNRRVIVINTYKAASELLDARSNIYSDRPQAWMLKEVVGRKFAVFNIPSQHPRFRKYRKLLHSGLNSRAVQDYYPLFKEEARALVGRLLDTPERFIRHIRQNAGAVILKLAYGWTVDGTEDALVVAAENAVKIQMEIAKPGQWLVEIFPFLRFVPAWFPGAGWKRKALAYRAGMDKIDRKGFDWVKEQMASGSFIPSFTSNNLRPDDGHLPDAEEEDIIKWCSSGLYAGGADTTVGIMTAFFAAMALYPEVQQRAQEEVQRIIGSGELDQDGEEDLPYICAIIKETLRWGHPVPLGLPHSVIQDDEYMGCLIPQGATIFANIWGMAHDEEVYPDPFTFRPERFLGTEPQLDPKKFVFGFGRRICPGALFAEKSLLTTIVAILRVYDIRKAIDDNGNEIEVSITRTPGITSHFKPFPCRLISRRSVVDV